jgi:hypothetical protein
VRIDDQIKRWRFFKQSPIVGADSHTKLSLHRKCAFRQETVALAGRDTTVALAHGGRCDMLGSVTETSQAKGIVPCDRLSCFGKLECE